MSRRDGVILAAGFGSRLRAEGDFDLKPLTPVLGIPLLLRAVRSLEVAGCERVVVVLGHGGGEVERALTGWAPRAKIVVARNDRPDLANGVSVLIAAAVASPSFILTMADHVLGDEIMELARNHQPPDGGATLLVDRRVDAVFDLDDATKVATRDGLVQRIGKTLATYDAIDTGVFLATPGLVGALAQVRASRGDASLSQGVQLLADRGCMAALDIGEGFWQDVDTPAMLAHAETQLTVRER